MVWLSLTSQKSSRIKTLFEKDFLEREGKVKMVAVFQFPQNFVEDDKESL